VSPFGIASTAPYGCPAVSGVGGPAVGAGRAAEAEVDPPGRQRVEHPELLGDLERRVVRQHDAGAAHPDGAGVGGDGGDQNLRRGADDGRVAVVLRHPEPVVPEGVAQLRQRQRVADRLPLRAAGGGDRLVEDGNAHGGHS
jgi:hypothetical protein